MTYLSPSATSEVLAFRADIIASIRRFFYKRKVLEVETPLLSSATVSDPYIHSLAVTHQRGKWYLQTSPEYAMKRLLVNGSGPIYQICKAFRDDEFGRFHNPEFTLLEWYRPGFDHHQLMDEMDALLQVVLNCGTAQRITYTDLFQQYFNINPLTVDEKILHVLADEAGINLSMGEYERDDWLQLLLTHVIEPHLGNTQPIFIYDFPPSQAALAKIQPGTPAVASRFEVYINGIELANGYHELTDAEEQRKRFEDDLSKRQQLGYPIVPIDKNLLAALARGMPDCAGVALGLDRLIMIAAKKACLAEVISFPIDRV